MRRRRTDLIFALVLIGGLIVAIVLIAGSLSTFTGIEQGVPLGDHVGVVDVIGPIYDARSWVGEIDDYRESSRIKAIVVRFDSPGGAVAASQELYEAVKRARDEKPVVVSMGNVAASGAYYASLGADTIVANPGTTTGSIGVIMELLVLEDLMDKLGLESEVVKSGVFKDAGNPTRPLTGEERDYFQNYIDDAYAEFVSVVAKERELEEAAVRAVSDGRVFTGSQAAELGLVDVLGDQYLAVRIAADMAGIDGDPSVVKPRRQKDIDWIDWLLDSFLDRAGDRVVSDGLFQYRWKAELAR
ncbi:MAG: putative signal peptide peptidase SppA [Calditrichaeota bacterium]|nr:putative signal peptide peptidase SppA [Calditrichota bacterium]